VQAHLHENNLIHTTKLTKSLLRTFARALELQKRASPSANPYPLGMDQKRSVY
jgi:hypothetical protein